ncbi:hypothetical protein Ancab_040632 [Ancistrocladus abbreviatus]
MPQGHFFIKKKKKFKTSPAPKHRLSLSLLPPPCPSLIAAVSALFPSPRLHHNLAAVVTAASPIPYPFPLCPSPPLCGPLCSRIIPLYFGFPHHHYPSICILPHHHNLILLLFIFLLYYMSSVMQLRSSSSPLRIKTEVACELR